MSLLPLLCLVQVAGVRKGLLFLHGKDCDMLCRNIGFHLTLGFGLGTRFLISLARFVVFLNSASLFYDFVTI